MTPKLEQIHPVSTGAPGIRKRLFVFLVLGTSCVLCLLLLLGWVVPLIGFKNIHPVLPYVSGAVFLGGIGFIVLATLGLVVHVQTGKPFLGSRKFRALSIRFFLPLMELLGRLAGVSPSDVRHSFIKVNNELVLTDTRRYRPEEILVLLPHCLQFTGCDLRLTHNPSNCRRCGRCTIGGFLDLQDRYGFHLAVATGGSIARRIVVEKRPSFILAVACERDLSSGIQDTYPLPVFGLLNSRPFGPCINTQVALDEVELAIKHFITAAE